MFSLEAKLSEICIGAGSAELMVALTTIERFLNIAPQRRRIDVAQQIQTFRAERQMDGIQKAKERGIEFGRKKKLTDNEKIELQNRRREGDLN